MAEYKSIKIGKNTGVNLKDTTARNKIEELEEIKMDKFSVSEPLKLNNKTLSIDSNLFKNKEEDISEKQELQNNIVSLAESNLDKFNNIYNFLKNIFGDDIYSSEDGNLIIDINSPIKLENYNETITNLINNKCAELASINENNKNEINESIQSINEQLTTNINQNKEANDEEINKLKKRCSLLEKEVFGNIESSTASEDNYSTIESRFDTLDEQLKTIVDALKRVGIIKEE